MKKKSELLKDRGIFISIIAIIIGVSLLAFAVFIVSSASLPAVKGESSAEETASTPVSNSQESSEPEISDNSHDDESREELLARDRFLSLEDKLDKDIFSSDFADYIIKAHGFSTLNTISDALEDGSYTDELWHDVTGYTLIVHLDIFNQRLDPSSPTYDPYISFKGDSKTEGIISLGFGGDFSFADNYFVAQAYDRRGEDLDAIIDPNLVALMKTHDLMMLNNEFTVSDRGSPIAGKNYTFRANPSRLWIYRALGVEIVSTANNHIYDFGEDAFLDTLEHLSAAGIKYVGAGKNLEEAEQGWYFIINGRKIGIVCASRANEGSVIHTKGATETTAGILHAYDSEPMIKVVEKAKAQCDFLIVYMHWSREYSTSIKSIIRTQGKQYIDAGADIILGCHAHIPQGIEVYEGKLLIYSLGNFLFNAKSLDSCMVTLQIYNDGRMEAYYTPLLQKSTKVSLAGAADAQRIRDLIYAISINAKINDDGLIVPAD